MKYEEAHNLGLETNHAVLLGLVHELFVGGSSTNAHTLKTCLRSSVFTQSYYLFPLHVCSRCGTIHEYPNTNITTLICSNCYGTPDNQVPKPCVDLTPWSGIFSLYPMMAHLELDYLSDLIAHYHSEGRKVQCTAIY